MVNFQGIIVVAFLAVLTTSIDARECSTILPVLNGVDVSTGGNDIGSVPATNWEACSHACVDRDGCDFWTWNRSWKVCYLKSGANVRYYYLQSENGVSGVMCCDD